MKTILEFDLEKSTQALNFFAQKEGGKINKLKAIKLIWLSDRLHLREYGRPITNDTYYAMKHGPVCSAVKDLAEASMIEDGEKAYLDGFLSRDSKNYEVISINKIDIDVFSDSEVECLTRVYEFYGDKEKYAIRDLSHDFPEWKKFESELGGDRMSFRKPMSYLDFFLDPENKCFPLFEQTKERLSASKEQFIENYEVANYWQ